MLQVFDMDDIAAEYYRVLFVDQGIVPFIGETIISQIDQLEVTFSAVWNGYRTPVRFTFSVQAGK